LLSNVWNGGSASNAGTGDTLTITGTRGDGSAVNMTFAIGGTTTVQDLLDALNNTTDGFGAGTRPATASIDAGGHIVVTDNTAGSSALSVQIVSNNESGGRLDLGAFQQNQTGRSRELVSGADAKFSIDGVMFTRSSNVVSDAIANVTLTLTGADPSSSATVNVDRSTTLAENAMQTYVDAYNKLIDFMQQQQTPGSDSSSNPPLYNDPQLRLTRSALPTSMLTPVAGASSDMATAGMVGISLTKDGHLSFDSNKFETAFTTRYSDVQKLFMEDGSTTNSKLLYTASTTATQSGTYDVNITQAAQQAQIASSGFSGTYSDDATPDVMSVTDLANNSTARVQLSNGMTTSQIVDAMNATFSTAEARALTSSGTLFDATGATAATTATLMTDLHSASGTALGVADGDTITYSGTRDDGSAFSGTFTVTATSSLGDLVTQVQSSIGGGAKVSLTNGHLLITSKTSGTSSLGLSLTSNNEGGGSLDFGSMDVTAEGHGIMSLVASASGNDIQITHKSYGSTVGIGVAFSGGGTDSTAQLGITAGDVYGTDVAGTIGGYAATGSGRQLVGKSGTPVDGLSMTYTDTTTGDVGSLTLTQGVGVIIDRLLDSWTDVTGTLSFKEQSLNDLISNQQNQLDAFNTRMDLRKQTLLKQYLAMDTAVQQINSQGNALLSALSSGSNSASSPF
jgi:flagellar hook-associated protein 2